MKEKIKKLLSEYRKQLKESELKVKECVSKHKYGEAQQHQSKAVAIESCILDLEEVIK